MSRASWPYLATAFPLHRHWTARLLDAPKSIRVDVGSSNYRKRVGRAFEYAMGLDLMDVPYPDRMECLLDEQGAWIRCCVSEFRDRQEAESLLRAGAYLGYLHPIVQGTGIDHSPEDARKVFAVDPQRWGPGSDEDDWQSMRCELTELWTVHSPTVRDQLRGWKPVAGAVPLPYGVVNGSTVKSYADFVAGDVLLEIKTGLVETEEKAIGALSQLLEYALMCPGAGHSITRVGLYLVRYGWLKIWRLQELADELAGGPVDLVHTAAELRGALSG